MLLIICNYLCNKDRLLSETDGCKKKNKDVDDDLQKTKDDIAKQIAQEKKEVRFNHLTTV